ncbi:SDR family NAD(P)-dependent oxidoreductase [Pseudonocardia adelaidensis]|uniref:SDR family oxidoreductase n=1 Tax=Pseudonocardia adelaidensis TaxID=648754 RepID=A0ABP9P3L0_9PSEU
MLDDLKGKSAIVTGAGSGIGLACALELLQLGCAVMAADINASGESEVRERAAAIGGGKLEFIRADISREDDVRAMVQSAVDAFGRLDGAINSAGFGPVGHAVHEMTSDEWDRNLATNLRGMFLCLKYQISAMRQQGGGSIVAISSTAAELPILRGAEYSSAKAGMNSLVRVAALENSREGVRVNAIMPGATYTPAHVKSLEAVPEQIEVVKALPMGRVAQPDEISGMAAFLLSDRASYITGTSIPIEGGILLV